MRLRTEMLGTEPGDALLAYDADCGLSPERQAEHDAMAAHALLRAIEAWGKHPGYQGGASWVEKRAAEILAGWLGEE